MVCVCLGYVGESYQISKRCRHQSLLIITTNRINNNTIQNLFAGNSYQDEKQSCTRSLVGMIDRLLDSNTM